MARTMPAAERSRLRVERRQLESQRAARRNLAQKAALGLGRSLHSERRRLVLIVLASLLAWYVVLPALLH